MAKIIIKRTNEWNNRARGIGIYLDRQKIGTIANGETKEFDISIGKHNLQAKIDWCGSRELSCLIDEHEIKTVTISGFKYGKYLMRGIGGLLALHFILKFGFDIEFLIWLIIPALLVLVYYLTIGRNSYLLIKEY